MRQHLQIQRRGQCCNEDSKIFEAQLKSFCLKINPRIFRKIMGDLYRILGGGTFPYLPQKFRQNHSKGFFAMNQNRILATMAAKKVCDCAKSSRLPLNFLMNSGWGYLSLPSLEISAKSQQAIFCYEPKQDFSDNSDLQWQPKKCVLRKIQPFPPQFFDEFWVGVPSPTFPRNFGKITARDFLL